MFGNTTPHDIKIGFLGGFQDSPLKSVEQEYILAHFVRMSQEQNTWVASFDIAGFLQDFQFLPFFPGGFKDFEIHFRALLSAGYLEQAGAGEEQTFRATKKFADLCIAYAA